MADTKLPDLPALTAVAAGDLFYVVDISDTTDDAAGSSKKITLEKVLTNPTATGTLKVLQSGGTPGTDELSLTDDGTNSRISTGQAGLMLSAAGCSAGYELQIITVGGTAVLTTSTNTPVRANLALTNSGGGQIWDISGNNFRSVYDDQLIVWSSSCGISGNSSAIQINNGTNGRWFPLKSGTYDAGTTTITDGLIVGHRSSGTPAAGLGSAILFNIDSSTTADQAAGRLSFSWATATHASRLSKAAISVYDVSTSRDAIVCEAISGGIENTLYGKQIIRQVGGTPGTDEGQARHDGTRFYVESKDGGVRFTVPTGSSEGLSFFRQDGTVDTGFSVSITGQITGSFYTGSLSGMRIGVAGNSVQMGSSWELIWYSANWTDTADLTLSRAAAGVLQAKTGSTANWIQNTAGEAALELAFTRSDATMTSTNLSLTVIAGRSYRITGYLIVSNSTAGEGAKFDFDGGTATATTFDVTFNAVGGTVVAGTIAATALDTDLNYTSITGTTRIFVQGYLEVNAGGTFVLRAAEDTTATGTMTLAAGSWLALADTVDK